MISRYQAISIGFVVMLTAAACASNELVVTYSAPLDVPDTKPPDGAYDRVHGSCGFVFDPPPFAGQVVLRLADGALVPAAGVEFWRGIGEESVAEGKLKQEAIRVDEVGHFSHRVSISANTTTYYLKGKAVAQTDYLEDVVFVIRAAGCRELLVHFTEDWAEQILILECPGRHALIRGALSNFGIQPTLGRAALLLGGGAARGG